VALPPVHDSFFSTPSKPAPISALATFFMVAE
jgi:hypothetical protein